MYVSYPLKTKKLCACLKAHSKDKQYFVYLRHFLESNKLIDIK